MKIKLSFILAILFIASSFSGAVHANDREVLRMIDDLKHEVRSLTREVRRLSDRLDGDIVSTVPNHKKWGCYLKDSRVGGISTTGHTMAEAKGLLLEKCTEMVGACVVDSIVCSNE